MKYPKLLAATQSDSILAVIENLPVSANGFFMTEDQMANVEAALAAAGAAATQLEIANASIVTATASLATANEQLTAANSQLTTANSQLTTAQARITELEAMGGNPVLTSRTEDAQEPGVSAKKYETSFDRMVG